MPAEYGRTAGGVFNFSLKSGTNQFRGSVYGLPVEHPLLPVPPAAPAPADRPPA